MEHYIVVDVGTSSLKSMLYTAAGALVYRAGEEYHADFGGGDRVEQEPATWRTALHKTLKDAAEYAREKNLGIAALAVTSQRASVIPVDRGGRPLGAAIMWQDKRSLAQCEAMLAKMSLGDINRKTGLRVDPYFAAPKMMWLKRERPDLYRRTYKLLGVQDYVVYLLTGRFVTDWSQACRTMLMNIHTFEWDEDMLRLSGVERPLLPDLQPPGAPVGAVRDELAVAAGLPKGIPVVVAGGDQQCAALALNILSPGIAEANTGTGSFVIAYSDRPRFDDECRTLCSAAAVPGKWILEAGIFNTGATHRWFKEQFYAAHESQYRLMNEEAAQSPVGANGVMMLPHFEGSAAPYWNPKARGGFFNLTMASKRGDFVRAILEGVALEIGHNLSLLEKLAGRLSRVSVAGGLTSLTLFNQIQADAFNREVLRYENNEASSLGALISALVTRGVYRDYAAAFRSLCPSEPLRFTPDRENAARYRRLAERKDAIYRALQAHGVYDLMSAPLTPANRRPD